MRLYTLWLAIFTDVKPNKYTRCSFPRCESDELNAMGSRDCFALRGAKRRLARVTARLFSDVAGDGVFQRSPPSGPSPWSEPRNNAIYFQKPTAKRLSSDVRRRRARRDARIKRALSSCSGEGSGAAGMRPAGEAASGLDHGCGCRASAVIWSNSIFAPFAD